MTTTTNCLHHWHIDSHDIGTCQLCGEVKDFGKLLYGRSHKSSLTPLAAAALKRWEDPEYRAKQAASKLLGWEKRKHQELRK